MSAPKIILETSINTQWRIIFKNIISDELWGGFRALRKFMELAAGVVNEFFAATILLRVLIFGKDFS